MRGCDPLIKVAGPWQDYSLKWLEQGIDASGFCCQIKDTGKTGSSPSQKVVVGAHNFVEAENRHCSMLP
jgi:hypothetical protein